MAKAIALLDQVDRHHLETYLEEGFAAALTKDNHYTLFRYEDWPAWVIFTSVFMVLIVFDNVILNRNPAALTVTRAVLYTLFWVMMACGFCVWVAWYKTPAAAFMWMN